MATKSSSDDKKEACSKPNIVVIATELDVAVRRQQLPHG